MAVLVQIAATLLTGVIVRGACEMYDIHRDAPVLIIIAMWAMWKVLGPTPVYEENLNQPRNAQGGSDPI